MKKHLLLTLLLIFIFLACFRALRTPVKAQEGIPDPLSQYSVKEETKKMIEKVVFFWRPINEKGTQLWNETIKPELKEWWEKRKEAIKQGFREEREELKGGLKESLSRAWNKIKELFKKEAKETIEEF